MSHETSPKSCKSGVFRQMDCKTYFANMVTGQMGGGRRTAGIWSAQGSAMVPEARTHRTPEDRGHRESIPTPSPCAFLYCPAAIMLHNMPNNYTQCIKYIHNMSIGWKANCGTAAADPDSRSRYSGPPCLAREPLHPQRGRSRS